MTGLRFGVRFLAQITRIEEYVRAWGLVEELDAAARGVVIGTEQVRHSVHRSRPPPSTRACQALTASTTRHPRENS